MKLTPASLSPTAATLFLLLSGAACKSAADPSPRPARLSLEGEWSVEALGEEDTLDPGLAFLHFGADGQLHGNAGVNSIQGSWSLEGDRLQVSGLITTLKAGPPAAMQAEQLLLAVLGGEALVRQEGPARLCLLTPEGQPGVQLLRREHALSVGEQASLSGTVSYRERIALTPGHRLVVELQDVSRADAPALVLGRSEAPVTGQVPLDFSLEYKPSELQPGHSYGLRAMLYDAAGRLAWTTTQHHAVALDDPKPQVGDLLLQRVQ